MSVIAPTIVPPMSSSMFILIYQYLRTCLISFEENSDETKLGHGK